MVVQGNTITVPLAQSDGPYLLYAEISGKKSWKPRFHELEHESNMWLLQNPTPTPLNSEATKTARNAN